MKLEKLAKLLIQTKKSLKTNNESYSKLKQDQKTTFTQMLIEKQQLKLVQCLYWNDKEIRTDKNFIKLYESINSNYLNLKSEYNNRITLIKLSKRLINDRQHEIGKLTHKIINYNNL